MRVLVKPLLMGRELPNILAAAHRILLRGRVALARRRRRHRGPISDVWYCQRPAGREFPNQQKASICIVRLIGRTNDAVITAVVKRTGQGDENYVTTFHRMRLEALLAYLKRDKAIGGDPAQLLAWLRERTR